MAGNQNNYFQRLADHQRVERPQEDETSKSRPSSSVSPSNQSLSTRFSLDDLKNMFKSAIDAEVVELIWQDSNENSDVALTYLTEISPTSVPIAAAVKTNSWSSVIGADTSKQFTVNQGVKPKTIIKEKHWVVDKIQKRISAQERIVIIMRGVPGSGKSYLAYQLRGNGVVLSTDDYFINYQGQYVFDRNQLSFAHDWNQNRADKEMKSGTNPVVIDNTNLEAWEMQPYVTMALRHNYSVELVEPDTPWREDVRILSQKNTHRVPRDKIRDMLEKQKVVIDMGWVIESCRRKMNQTFEGTTSLSTLKAEVKNFDAERNSSTSSVTNSTNKHWPNNQQPVEKNDSLTTVLTFPLEKNITSKPATSPYQSPDVLVSHDAAAIALKPSTSEIAIQTSLSDPTLRELSARSCSIQTSNFVPDFGNKPYSSKFSLDKGCLTDDIVEELPTATREAIAILKSYFPTKEKEDLADILKQCNGDLTWAVNLLLDSGYECANEVSDDLQLEDEIDQPEEKPNTTNSESFPLENLPPNAKDDETNSVASSEASQQSYSNASVTSEETEALRKHIEDCFQLTDTISEQTRRICGKDYNQFRASQLQKLRVPSTQNQVSEGIATVSNSSTSLMSLHNQTKNDSYHLSFAGFPTLGEIPVNGLDPQVPQETIVTENMIGLQGFDLLQQPVASPPLSEEEVKIEDGATISMTLDPSFVQQLVSLFGVPDLKTNRPFSSNSQSTPVKFDIPWSLAEQIYMLWCSSLISKDEEQSTIVEGENRELQNIMDFELAMQLVQDERNAERKELRESLSTKLSFQMLKENYPFVDPLALDALFEANNYNYSHTVTALNASLGTKPQPPKNQVVATNPPATREESQTRTPNKREPKTESRDLRTEAFLYNRLRQQYSAQAQEYHQRGMSAAAMYYSSESRRYAELYKKCNQQAALQIVEEKNAHQDERTIDLHELHVVEALTCLESFIVENVREGRTVVQVITGRGNNSQNGKPRIKPAVVTFLKQKKYGFEELNPGMLRVFLSPRSTTRRVPS